MATYRVHATKDYTVMSNAHLRDKAMSLKAKGLLSVMLALPDTWNYSINGLVAICKENNTAVESALKELKMLGYLIVTKKMPNETESGRIEYEYDIYETPQAAQIQTAEKQRIEKQGVENQGVENSGQSIIKESITEKEIIKESITEKNSETIVAYLNERAGTKYRAKNKDTQKHINARITEGFTVDDFKTVIDKKCAEWRGTEWEKFLRPTTLFGTKFESYLNAPVSKRTTVGATGVAINTPVEDDLAGIF